MPGTSRQSARALKLCAGKIHGFHLVATGGRDRIVAIASVTTGETEVAVMASGETEATGVILDFAGIVVAGATPAEIVDKTMPASVETVDRVTPVCAEIAVPDTQASGRKNGPS